MGAARKVVGGIAGAAAVRMRGAWAALAKEKDRVAGEGGGIHTGLSKFLVKRHDCLVRIHTPPSPSKGQRSRLTGLDVGIAVGSVKDGELHQLHLLQAILPLRLEMGGERLDHGDVRGGGVERSGPQEE